MSGKRDEDVPWTIGGVRVIEHEAYTALQKQADALAESLFQYTEISGFKDIALDAIESYRKFKESEK